MEFPAYVPAAVRTNIARYLEGESGGSIPGYVELLAGAEEQLAKIERAIEGRRKRGDDDYLPSLNDQRAEALKHRDMLSNDVACLQRLAHDARMREAFALLTREFTEDQQWGGFIFSAWVGRIDYGSYRDRLKRSGELKGDIEKAAESLASLLRQFSKIGVTGPDEFYSVSELLRKTDNHDMRDHNLEMWRGLRGGLLGDRRTPPPPRTQETTPAGGLHNVRLELIPLDKNESIDREQQERDTLRYVWQLAPDLSALLDTVAQAARDFTPAETGMVGAAIVSRQRSIKTEYLRGFANRLTDNRLTLTTAVMQAMAVVANVAINSPEVDVSYDDVRKALAKLGVDQSGKLD